MNEKKYHNNHDESDSNMFELLELYKKFKK